jgi:hypothetical protein
VGDEFYLQHAPIPIAPGNEGIEIPMPTEHKWSLWWTPNWDKNVEDINGLDATLPI